jgi:hypothetical protein
MKYSLDGGVTWHNAHEVRVSNHIGEDHFEVVTITCTQEGIIEDVWDGDQLVATSVSEWIDRVPIDQ